MLTTDIPVKLAAMRLFDLGRSPCDVAPHFATVSPWAANSKSRSILCGFTRASGYLNGDAGEGQERPLPVLRVK